MDITSAMLVVSQHDHDHHDHHHRHHHHHDRHHLGGGKYG